MTFAARNTGRRRRFGRGSQSTWWVGCLHGFSSMGGVGVRFRMVAVDDALLVRQGKSRADRRSRPPYLSPFLCE